MSKNEISDIGLSCVSNRVFPDNLLFKGKNDLIHYTNVDGFFGIISSKKGLMLSDYRFLNDASEYNNGFEITKSLISQIIKEWKNDYDDNFLNILGNVPSCIESIRGGKPIYIGSFSTKEDDLYQWISYGKNAPIAISFDSSSKDFFSYAALPYRVIYNNNDKKNVLLKVINSYHELWLKDISQNLDLTLIFFDAWIEQISHRIGFILPTFKDSKFSNENEVRIVYYDDFPAPPKKHHRSDGSLIIPFVYSHEFTNRLVLLPIKKVTIGPSAHQQQIKQSVKIFLKDCGYGNVNVETSSIPYRGNKIS